MSITILNYYDQALVDSINAQAAARAEAARAEAAQLEAASSASSTETSFSDALNQAAESYTQSNTAATGSTDLSSIFEEASNTFGVSVNLLESIAKAESNFDANAVSSAGAIGVMQLMPATAAAMGVTDAYDAYQNIMGGAKYISQLLQQYSGNISLALAAYNAGSSNVDQYGGIPPFTETQNYVKKVLYYLENGVSSAYTGSSASTDTSSSDISSLGQTITNLLSGNTLSNDTLDALANLILTLKTDEVSSDTASDTTDNTVSDTTGSTASDASADSSSDTASQSITVTVLNGTDTI